ncbi:hypothetical protein ACFL3I_02105 [Pseudomonadota bacterium]
MKNVQHANKKDVFADWISANLCSLSDSEVYWPQICYDWSSEHPIHIIFEKNRQSFNWPWQSAIYLPYSFTNIDFTTSPPSLANGSRWNYENWYQDALNGPLQKVAECDPVSFWNWRLMTRPKGNLTCDLDVLYNKGGLWIGVEATEIWYVDENSQNFDEDCFQHVCNLIHKRKAFNFKALRAQCTFMEALNGEHYFVLHRIDKGTSTLVDDKVMVLPLNSQTIAVLESGTGSREDVKNNLGHLFRFQSLSDFFEI